MDYETYLLRRGREMIAAQKDTPLVLTEDAQPESSSKRKARGIPARDAARLNAKLDRAIALMARQQLPGPVMDPGLTPSQMAAQWQREYEKNQARICAEAKAAYDARNPHKKNQGEG